MEIKINKEIRGFSEKIFFGLSLRQFIFSVLACIVALILYLILKSKIGTEIASWICILSAIPFGIIGFVKYNEMKAEEFIMRWIESKILFPSHFFFQSENYYAKLYKENIEMNLKQNKNLKNIKIGG